ncbi:hypothetical protein SH1V18_00890 [Vallitalea longa]|uniref:HTH araC/xylS-type domain-containing protein n=1 Tax=Vallitalea longa TaxID=2936439 RepID=A0A9W5Y924_9FIRM|nr:AraC family transcriptional regulator [Vallitalea longa]GKX27609.1 hypothetical protein SH1V18_00890 [Vallitalea longa]
MQKTFFPVILEKQKKLPIYLTSAGCDFYQESVDRTYGFPSYHWIQCSMGKGKIKINNERIILEKNMGMIIHKDVPHYYEPLCEKWLTDWVTFDGFAVKQLLNTLGFYKSNYYYINDISGIREKIVNCIDIGNHYNNYIELSIMNYDFVMTLPKYINRSSSPDYTTKIDIVINYINDNFYSALTIDSLANLIKVTPQYLCNIFSKATNKRPFEYVNEVRIQKSKELMLNTNFTIHEISKKVGFEDASYYGKWFKRIEKMTPGSFRKHYKGY